MRGPNPQGRFRSLGVMTVPWGGKTTQEAFHPGVDIANVKGTPIPSTVPGVVTQAEGGHVQGENNFGNSVSIKDAEGNTHQYHHLQNINVRPGQQVVQGQQVATMGNSGAAYSPSGKGDGTNLDYRIVSAYGQYKNPMTYIKNIDPSIEGKVDGSGGPGAGNPGLILVRHGTTKLNSDEKIRGWSNPPLDKKGKSEVDKLGKSMKNQGIHSIMTSDLVRAKQTADAISKHTGAPITEVTKDLRPWDLGEMTGKPVKETLPLIGHYAKNKPGEKVPGGESFNTFRDRFLGKLKSISKTNLGKKVAVVAHHRNDRLMAAWEKKGMPADHSIDIDTFLQKGIDPATARLLKTQL